MDIIIKVLGYLALAFLALLGLGLAWIVWKWKQIKTAMQSVAPPPLSIAIVPDPKPLWAADRTARDVGAEFARLGYQDLGNFLVEGIAGVALTAYCHAGLGIYACYYNHAQAGRWIDLCANLQDGLEITVSSARQGHQLDTRPGTEKKFLPNDTLTTLHETLVQRLAGHAVAPASPTADAFVSEFTAAYARDMEWRTGRNGISAEEFNRIAETTEHGLEQERWPEAFTESKLQELQIWSEAALEEFERVTTLSVSDWKRHEGSMLIHHEDFHGPAYVAYVGGELGLDDEEIAKLREAVNHGLSLRGSLDRMAVAAKVTLKELGTVNRPRPATIFGYTTATEPSA